MCNECIRALYEKLDEKKGDLLHIINSKVTGIQCCGRQLLNLHIMDSKVNDIQWCGRSLSKFTPIKIETLTHFCTLTKLYVTADASIDVWAFANRIRCLPTLSTLDVQINNIDAGYFGVWSEYKPFMVACPQLTVMKITFVLKDGTIVDVDDHNVRHLSQRVYYGLLRWLARSRHSVCRKIIQIETDTQEPIVCLSTNFGLLLT